MTTATTHDPGGRRDPVADLNGSAVTIAQKLLAQLPESGAVIVIGSLSAVTRGREMVEQVALAFQTITAKPTLVIQTGLETPGPSHTHQPDPHPDRPTTDGPGLTDLLARPAGISRDLPRPCDLGPTFLDYGTLGANAAERLVSDTFRIFIEEARRPFRWVLLHTPNLLEQRQAASLIARADCVVGFLQSGRGRGRAVQELRDLCEGLKRPLAGIILL